MTALYDREDRQFSSTPFRHYPHDVARDVFSSLQFGSLDLVNQLLHSFCSSLLAKHKAGEPIIVSGVYDQGGRLGHGRSRVNRYRSRH